MDALNLKIDDIVNEIANLENELEDLYLYIEKRLISFNQSF